MASKGKPETGNVFNKGISMIHTPWFFGLIAILYAAALLFCLMGRSRGCTIFLSLGALLNAAFLVHHSLFTGVFISNALVDSVFFKPFTIVLAILYLSVKTEGSRRGVGSGILFLLAATVFAVFYPKGIIPPAANKTGVCPFLFSVFENVAYGLFGLSAVLALLFPKEEILLKSLRRTIVTGFIFFSIAQVVGALWSFQGWGHPFMWGARHLSSAAVWLFYGALIHMRILSSFVIPERQLAVAGGALAVYITYSHLISEMGIHRIGG
jgi:ABC-type transport system involved in cytochrome c biogenesis permease subunit